MNPNTRLLIVGSGEEERNIRSDLSKELAGHLAHIELDVGHERLAEWYRAMDLLLMPSRYENFSNTLIEGMACGIPFLASDVGGNRILGETGAGWLFESESLSACSSRLGKILENRSEMRNRGEVGYQYARKCHTWAVSAQRLEEIITCGLGVKE
jgi:D-inositol-3-phosphate glycosyltransferase